MLVISARRKYRMLGKKSWHREIQQIAVSPHFNGRTVLHSCNTGVLSLGPTETRINVRLFSVFVCLSM